MGKCPKQNNEIMKKLFETNGNMECTRIKLKLKKL